MGKGNTLTPSFTITEPDGDALGVSVPKGKGAIVKKLLVKMTGLHRVSIAGGGSTGAYLVRTKAKVPTSVQMVVEVGNSGGSAMFQGIPGMTIKSLSVKALKPKGQFATVDGQAANLQPQVYSLVALGACVAPATLSALVTSKSGKATKGKNVAELIRAGTHRLDIVGGDTVGFAKIVVKLQLAKGKGDVQEEE